MPVVSGLGSLPSKFRGICLGICLYPVLLLLLFCILREREREAGLPQEFFGDNTTTFLNASISVLQVPDSALKVDDGRLNALYCSVQLV